MWAFPKPNINRVTCNFTPKKRDKIYVDIMKCVDKTMETLWSLEENRNAFAKAHPELNISKFTENESTPC